MRDNYHSNYHRTDTSCMPIDAILKHFNLEQRLLNHSLYE